MEFFFPVIAAEIDWMRRPVSLDKELQKLSPTHVTGKRVADKLARVWRKKGGALYVLLHGEVQGQAVAQFNERMFTYNYRIKDRYNAPVVSLGVITGNAGNVRLGRYENELWGCRTTFEFPVVKMSDWRGREAELERSRNPFAMVVLVHLALPQAQDSLADKYAVKLHLIRRLLRHGFAANYVRSLLRFLDWVIQLPAELEQQLNNIVEEESGEKKMPYVTSWERRGIATGKLQLILQLLKVKFGSLDESLTARIEQLPVQKLEKLAEALLKFSDVSDLERWLKRRAS
ncbi:MAG TPA: DUF4351 domain-containing protein [Blastocatellia bacterium]|nr:DUF4351 domain-containing protein [Blastocatellia bacterium]